MNIFYIKSPQNIKIIEKAELVTHYNMLYKGFTKNKYISMMNHKNSIMV